MTYAIVKDNYVIARIVGEVGYIYPHPHDFQIADEEGNSHIGDWYEENEGIFYRPVNANPPDWPDVLQPTQTP